MDGKAQYTMIVTRERRGGSSAQKLRGEEKAVLLLSSTLRQIPQNLKTVTRELVFNF